MEVNNTETIITVAIPFYNASKFLSEAIESVINQTYTQWELILLDDGSNDNSLEIAKRYQSLDSRIRVISDGKNLNLAYRLNQISKLTNSEFLARMDADDIMHINRLKIQLEILDKNPEIDVLGTNAYSINEKSEIVGIRYKTYSPSVLQDVQHFIHPTIIARTQWFLKNPYDVNAVRIEDVELWIRTSGYSNFRMLSEPLLYYREFGSRYYIKYFKGIPSVFYLILKHKLRLKVLMFAAIYILSSIRSYVYYLIGQESIMILKRNKIKLKK